MTLRTMTFLVLILTGFNLTGLTATASTIMVAKTIDGCCDPSGSSQKQQPETPCSEGSCDCITCLTIECSWQVAFLTAHHSSRLPHPPSGTIYPDGYSRSIDYPPEV